MRTSTLGGAVAAAVLTLTTLAASPAHAELYGIDDGPDASGSLNDIHSLSARHGAGKVVVRTHFADLRRDAVAGMSIFLDTDRGDRGPEYRLGTGLSDGTDYALAAVEGWVDDGRQVTDCFYVLDLRWARDSAVAAIDRDCLGTPAEVRVSVKMRDDVDASHPVTDWVPGPRRWSLWLDPA